LERFFRESNRSSYLYAAKTNECRQRGRVELKKRKTEIKKIKLEKNKKLKGRVWKVDEVLLAGAAWLLTGVIVAASLLR